MSEVPLYVKPWGSRLSGFGARPKAMLTRRLKEWAVLMVSIEDGTRKAPPATRSELFTPFQPSIDFP